MKEVGAGHYAGPFKTPPSKYFIQSPLGLVPNANNKTRLIFHLLYDFSQKEEDRSVNYHTPSHLCSVKYKDLDHAIRSCLEMLKHAGLDSQIIFYSKMDSSNAFCLVPVLVRHRALLTMKAVHPLTNEVWFFIDKCLPFGSSRSCAIFQDFSDAIAFLAKVRITCKQICRNLAIMNYLDDFLFAALQMWLCNCIMQEFLHLCQEIGCPISQDKTEKASLIMIFLGMLLDGQSHVISMPLDKIIKAVNLIKEAIQKRKVTIKFIQRLTGTLNFLKRAIVPGRAFTRGMYDKLRLRDNKGELLRSHHHTYLGSEFIQDCYMWLYFLSNTDVCKLQICRPFSDFDDTQVWTVLSFYSDASLNWGLVQFSTTDGLSGNGPGIL